MMARACVWQKMKGETDYDEQKSVAGGSSLHIAGRLRGYGRNGNGGGACGCAAGGKG